MKQNSCHVHKGLGEVSKGKVFIAEMQGASILWPFFFLLSIIEENAYETNFGQDCFNDDFNNLEGERS